ncbi:MAG: aldo/keto reductase, partial [Spirochaetota bacterium]
AGSAGETLEALGLIKKAFELGVNLFDSADMYGVGHNEMLLGEALRDLPRDSIIVATKFGNMRRIDGAHLGVNGRPEYVKAACEMSLKRLGLGHIDLYYQHRVDPDVPIEETVGAMSDLVKEGKVRFIGLSEAGPATIRRANKVHPITALQTEYSLWSRDPEGEILATTRELGISFVAYSPLGRGFLTGAFKDRKQFAAKDFRSVNPRMSGDNFEANRALVAKIETLAAGEAVPASRIVLAWLLSKGPDIIPIPGTRQEKYLRDNIAAAELRLKPGLLSALETLMPPGAASGTRYDESGMKRLGL